ncbi:hypothetical protein NDU88_008151 [Pleurodeles waltl]|uniref:C2H2-type domain-containing protein n=1 Tax=Pleurodeles waltl TaxID=8319 RepID=A0AAV7SV31_PLEWA|nr:hypothetical protein NDU88_008151 [Pleurodeles waltl]
MRHAKRKKKDSRAQQHCCAQEEGLQPAGAGTWKQPACARHLNIRMEKREAPGKNRKVECSPELVRAALPVSPIHNVSASGSQNNAGRDHELELLSGNQPNVILLSMLQQLDAKLDNLQNTLEDVPSRVAGLMKQIWIEKGHYHLRNGGVSLGMVSPVTVRDCSFSRSPPINLSVRARELNQCLQPTSPHWREPLQSQSLQPMSQDGPGLQQDCTISRGPPLDVQVIPGEPNLHSPSFDDESQQDQCMQLEPEERMKKEQLYADSWDPQQNFYLQPPFHEGHKPRQNHCRQPMLPDKEESDECTKKELLWFDGEGPQQNHCRQPTFQEEKNLQHSACLQQVLSDAQEQPQNCKTELMHPEAQNADHHYKLEPLHPENCDVNYEQESLHPGDELLYEQGPLHPEDRDENYEQEPLHPEDRDENYNQEPLHPEDRDEKYEQEPLHPEDRDETYEQEPLHPVDQDEDYEQEPLHPEDRDKNSDLQLTCTDAQVPSVSSSFLVQNTAVTDGAIATDPLERGNTESDVLLFKSIPAQKPQTESMNSKEKHKASEGRKNFAHKINERKHHSIHNGLGAYPFAECQTTFAGKTHLLPHEETHTGLGQYPCTEHETWFADKETLICQEKTPCNIFEKHFMHKVDLQNHQRIHTRGRLYHCKECVKSFPGKSHLVQHQRMHTGEKPYSCTVCEKSFNRKGNLVDHERIHTGEKPYSCTVCEKSFNRKRNLVDHKRIHTGEKPYSCTVCEKSFNRKRTLIEHQRLHAGENPYSCNVCAKSFTRKAILILHQLIHTGERPYSCSVCGKTFTLKGTLVRHQTRHTEERP